MRFALLGFLIALPLISAAGPQYDSDDWVSDDAPTCMKECAVQVGTELMTTSRTKPQNGGVCMVSMDDNIVDFTCVCQDEPFNKKWGQCIYAKCSETDVDIVLEDMTKSCADKGITFKEVLFKKGKDSGVGRSCASLGLVGVAAAGAVMAVL